MLGHKSMSENWLNKVNWSEDGLIPVVTQEASSNLVLMVAWMDRNALKLTIETGKAVYKGEESGHFQQVKEIYLDCDKDVILLMVEQVGGIACHTGRHNCFFNKLENKQWVVVAPVIKDPKEIYRK